MYNKAYEALGITKAAYEAVTDIEKELMGVFDAIERTESTNEARVLGAFIKNRVAAHNFNPTTGYGYDDVGRDGLDKVFADSFEAEAAVVSPQLVSGTHAIFCVLSGLLLPGETLLAISGRPYDTLVDAIGITDKIPGSLTEAGIEYRQIELVNGSEFDLVAIKNAIEALRPKVAYIQRSRGYAWRNSLTPDQIKEAAALIKATDSETVIVVDNCYGEFTQTVEPTVCGADIIVGSLIKNPGGGLAPTGGYFAGKRQYVERIASRMTVPGIGREAGSYFASYLPFYQGLFMAPHTVAQSLKSSVLFSAIFESMGLATLPSSTDVRSDIVQSLRFSSKEALIAFCKCIQSVSPVDSHVVPEPYAMPGYQSDVIMAAGAFVQGASIELSADAPIVEPYTCYVQGALSYSHGRLAAMRVFSELSNMK